VSVDNAPSERSTPRIRTLLRARVEYNGGATTVECTVRDLSDAGARLQIPESVVLPPNFTLFVPKHGRRYTAVLRWLRQGFAGVEFQNENSSAASDGDGDSRVAKLEAEVARLRRVIEAIRADPSQARLLVERFDLTSHQV
jgi:hypothetical protein